MKTIRLWSQTGTGPQWAGPGSKARRPEPNILGASNRQAETRQKTILRRPVGSILEAPSRQAEIRQKTILRRRELSHLRRIEQEGRRWQGPQPPG